MHIIILQQNNETKLTNTEELTKRYREMYQKSGNGMDTEDFFYENCAWDALNGEIGFDQKNDAVTFEYADRDKSRAYEHIEDCRNWMAERNGSFDQYVMAHVLMALYYGGPLSKDEYECMHTALCSYD